MISIPFRRSALALVLTAGSVVAARAQTTDATASPSPATSTQTAHTDAQGRRLAPHDTFYMLNYVSARTKDGVDGFPPGTEVHLVKVNKEAHTLIVTDGHDQVEVSPDRLTNDLDVAAAVRLKDQESQARVAAYQQAELQASQKYEKEAADYTAQDLQKREQAIRDNNERVQEAADPNHGMQPSTEQPAFSNYYNEGGNGYGSPYGYFYDLNSPVVVGNGQTGTTPTSSPGTTSAAAPLRPGSSGSSRGSLPSSGTGGAPGGAKPGGKP